MGEFLYVDATLQIMDGLKEFWRGAVNCIEILNVQDEKDKVILLYRP
jgi:hypothetical protein